MLSWRSSNVDEVVLAAFTEKGLLLPKEVAHWRVQHITGFITAYKAFVEMEPYMDSFQRIFSKRVLSEGKPLRTALVGGFALAAAQVG